MSFWEGVSTDRFRGVIVERGYEDLGFYFTQGMRGVTILNLPNLSYYNV